MEGGRRSRDLERDGLVKRTVFPSVPPRVDYELTARGHSLSAPIDTLAAWALEHIDAVDAIDADRAAFDQPRTKADKP